MAHAKVLLPYSTNYVKEMNADGTKDSSPIYVVGSVSGKNSYLQHLLASNAGPLQAVSYQLHTAVPAIALAIESFQIMRFKK
jgi:hypothetical protein